MSKTQPKVVQKMLIRFVIGSFIIAALFLLYGWWRAQGAVLDLGAASTVGQIAAIERLPNGGGDIAVLVKPDGTIQTAPNHGPGIVDRDVAWRPDGSRLLFSSDRDKRTFNIWMWKPESNSVDRMTTGSRGQGLPTFATDDRVAGNRTALMVAAGIVVEFNPIEQTRRQALPRRDREMPMSSPSDEGQGGQDTQFSADYAKFGTSFKSAKWAKNKKYIAAVMRREEGEVLIVQNMDPTTPEEAKPIPVVAGDKIQFDVDPSSGKIAYTVQNFQYVEITREMLDDQGRMKPEFAKKPFKHMLGIVDPDAPNDMKKSNVVAASKEDNHCFGMPAISPDGASVLVVEGPCKDGALDPQELDSMPFQPLGIRGLAHLIQGPVYEPSWSVDGSSFVFAMRNRSGKRAIFKATKDASSVVDLTGAKGDFSFPQMSPQLK